MNFGSVSYIQEGESCLFYHYDRAFKGYMIVGLFVSPNMHAKVDFYNLWKYFVSEVVTSDDIYCSVPLGIQNSMFDKYLEKHSVVDGHQVYKVDNALKDIYSTYTKHLEMKRLHSPDDEDPPSE